MRIVLSSIVEKIDLNFVKKMKFLPKNEIIYRYSMMTKVLPSVVVNLFLISHQKWVFQSKTD